MNLFENLQIMNESEDIKTFNISFKKNDVYQANLIKGYSEEQVTDYFKSYKPDAEVLGVKLATKDDERPGKPVIDATKESFISKDEPEEIIEWDDDVFDDQYDDGEDKTESSVLKDEKDMEQIVEGTETLTEDSADPKEALQTKANKLGLMIDTLGEEMSAHEINDFLRGLTNELDMDVYEDGEPYPTDLDGYFSEPVADLNLSDNADAELFNWVDEILTDCITKTTEFVKGRIETLRGEISALEISIKDLEDIL